MRTQLTNSGPPQTLATLLAQDITLLDSGAELPTAEDSISLDDVLNTEDLRLRWINSVRHQVSRQLLFLRRAQGLRQTEVAKKAGTSQSKIARIEAGEENVTVDTVERLVNAMGGRFVVSIPPANRPVTPGITEWWKNEGRSVDNPWLLRLAMGAEDDTGRHVFVWVSQPNTLTSPALITIQEAK